MRHKTCHDKKNVLLLWELWNIFSWEDNIYHMRGLSCPECCDIFCTKSQRKVHVKEKHVSISKIKHASHLNHYSVQMKHHRRENALDVFSTATVDFCEDIELDIFAFLNKLRLSIEYEFKYQLYEKNRFKCCLLLEVFLTFAFDKESNEGITSCFDSNTVGILSEDKITDYIDITFGEIMTVFEEFCEFELFYLQEL